MHGRQRADVRQHAIITARTALGDWWRVQLGQSWWELLADPATRTDALWQAASAVVLAVEPILGVAAVDDPHTSQLQRERDFLAGQVDALRSQIERLLEEWRAATDLTFTSGQAAGPQASVLPDGELGRPPPTPSRALAKH